MAERPPKTPDLSKAQLTAVVGSVVGVATSYGAPIPPEAADGIVQTVQVVAPALIAADFGKGWYRAKYDVFSKRVEEPDRELRRWSMRGQIVQGVGTILGFGVALAALVLTLT